MADLRNEVYNALFSATEEMAKTVKKRSEIDQKIASGRYSSATMANDLQPRRDALSKQIKSDADVAIANAQNLIQEFLAKAAKQDELDPSALTDDVKLLQAGIPLLPRDLEGILARSGGNRTMQQVVFRYAKEHGIEDIGAYRSAAADANTLANDILSVLSYYRRWIDKPNALQMLDKFFGKTH